VGDSVILIIQGFPPVAEGFTLLSMTLRRDPLANPEMLIRRVYSYVAYRIGDGPDAEDVTNETFARALRYRESFDEAKGDASSWLIGIARRCIAAHFAERGDVVADAVDRAAPGDLEEDAVRRIELSRVMRALNERDRELIALRYGADLTAKQIGELLGLRVNTVEVSLHRVLRRLRDELERGGGSRQSSAAQPAVASSYAPRR
jgi:RNA polymerase sigma factor (sigma-70 family)